MIREFLDSFSKYRVNKILMWLRYFKISSCDRITRFHKKCAVSKSSLSSIVSKESGFDNIETDFEYAKDYLLTEKD